MKIGDQIQIRNSPVTATIVKATIEHKWDSKKHKEITRTRYLAKENREDGITFLFYGFDVGKKIFRLPGKKQIDEDQLTIFENI